MQGVVQNPDRAIRCRRKVDERSKEAERSERSERKRKIRHVTGDWTKPRTAPELRPLPRPQPASTSCTTSSSPGLGPRVPGKVCHVEYEHDNEVIFTIPSLSTPTSHSNPHHFEPDDCPGDSDTNTTSSPTFDATYLMSEWMVTTSSAIVLDESILQLWLLGHSGKLLPALHRQLPALSPLRFHTRGD